MSKVHFTVFSQAYYVDTRWGFGCPSGGIKNMGNLFHKYNIPVTWLLSPKSARCEQEMLTEFHEEYGDEAAMCFRFNNEEINDGKEREFSKTLSVNDYRKLIKYQKNEIEKHLPWANLKTAGQGIRDERLLEALELEGFTGMFGHCYSQIGTDAITDFGMPWGSFPMRKKDAYRPAESTKEQGLIAFEWTMRDLNRSIHTTFPELWSTDPNDVERGGVCSDKNVEYWKNLYMEYEKALPFNDDGIWFQYHQEAHEQTWGEVCKPYNPYRIDYTTNMMDLFIEWLVKRDSVEFVTASQATELYKEKQKDTTIPMYIPYKWTDVPEEMDFWRQVAIKEGYAGEIHRNNRMFDKNLYRHLSAVNDADPISAMKNPPWTDSFFFFDHECQLIFDIHNLKPLALFNYLNYTPTKDLLKKAKTERGGGAAGFFLESDVPEIEIKTTDDRSRAELKITNIQDKTLPYGIFLWSVDFPEIVEGITSNKLVIKGAEHKVIQDRGIFLRLNLNSGINKIKI